MGKKIIKKRSLKGVVVSNKMHKTVVVAVDRLKKHPKYRKRYKSTKKYKVHDENNEFKIGDIVLIQETRPVSREKRWRVVEVVKRAISTRENSEKSE